MNNVLVMGAGRMGSAIAWAMSELGWKVSAVDTNSQALHNLTNIVPEFDAHFSNHTDALEKIFREKSPEIVISSLPYHQNAQVARQCISAGVRYCDLGGRVDVSQEINNHGKQKARKPIMTDLGLAPGWVNILSERGCQSIHRKVDNVQMMVGGLPTMPMNHPLDYMVTWSVDGLINEYKDDCEVLNNGELKKVAGMEGLQEVYIESLDKTLEAFYTSGGASHTIKDMMSRGVKNCNYKTLRYKGHQQIIKFLIRDSKLTNECLSQVFLNGCRNEADKGDMVIVKARVSGGDVSWDKEILIHSGQHKEIEFSAMQKATAFPISSVASLMAEGYFDNREIEHRGYKEKLPVVLSYKDVPFEKFDQNLKLLGLEV
ncbi:hypothetical protein CL634_08680 [bacterium]|nr:hypothetical protein [bacterium]